MQKKNIQTIQRRKTKERREENWENLKPREGNLEKLERNAVNGDKTKGKKVSK